MPPWRSASRRQHFRRPPLRCAPWPAIWLVIPTYNEAANLDRSSRAAAELERAAPGDHRILIVDDNSPDGTGAIADALAAESTVEVLHRPGKAGSASLPGRLRARAAAAPSW